jgi:hypothetical protein
MGSGMGLFLRRKRKLLKGLDRGTMCIAMFARVGVVGVFSFLFPFFLTMAYEPSLSSCYTHMLTNRIRFVAVLCYFPPLSFFLDDHASFPPRRLPAMRCNAMQQNTFSMKFTLLTLSSQVVRKMNNGKEQKASEHNVNLHKLCMPKEEFVLSPSRSFPTTSNATTYYPTRVRTYVIVL